MTLEDLCNVESPRITVLTPSLNHGRFLRQMIATVAAQSYRSFEHVVFEHARPGLVVVTTPNREYNAEFEGLPAGQFRHRDHRFEWTRAELQDWAGEVAGRHGDAQFASAIVLQHLHPFKA